MYKNFIHKLPIQIRFKDVDKQGHVNNANHITYFETGRIYYFDQVLGRNVDWDKTGILLARTEIDYFEPVFMEDEITVYTKVVRLGTKSFEMNNYLLKKSGEEYKECAFGKSILVSYDYTIRQTTEIPKDWREKFENFEKTIP
jgi:acyl-CoA thioester hydrolase